MTSSRSVSTRKTMIIAVALIAAVGSTAVAAGSGEMCVLQKNEILEEHKLSTLEDMFGEILTTESNENIYVVTICRPVPEMLYDPRKLSGAIKLTPEGNTVNLGHINQSNVIVKENSIVLTYVSGDRDRNVEDTCKGLRWKTHLTFFCDPLAIHDILTFINEDPDQPELCQVWFEVKTSKTCKRQSHLPLAIMGKDFSALKNQTDHEKFNVREPTNFNEIPSRKNPFHYKTSNFNQNRTSSNIENKEKPNINDLDNKFNKSVSNEYFSTRDENKTTNEEIKNGNLAEIISKEQEKQSGNENEDNYLNKYRKSLYDKNGKEEAKIDNSNTNTPEDKMSADHIMNNKLWIKKNMSQYENKEHYLSNNFENKFTYFKINNTVPSRSSNKEYSYPGKNETIAHYNDLKKYLDQSKNSEGKYENSVISESDKYNENRDGKINQDVPEDSSNNDIKFKYKNNENMEKTSKQKTFENKTSNKEMNDSGDKKKPSNNDNILNRDNSEKFNLNNNSRTYNKTPYSDNGIKYNTTNGGKIVDVSYQSQSKDNKSIAYDNKAPVDVTKENIANQTHSQNNNPEPKPFQKNETNVNGSITQSTPRTDSTTENKPTGSGNKVVDANTINTKTHSTNNDNPTIDADEKNKMKNDYSSTSISDDNIIAVTVEPTKTRPANTMVNDDTNESDKINSSSTESLVNRSLNNIKTNNKHESNGTVINEINNVNKNLQPDQSIPQPSAQSSNNDENDTIKMTTDNTNESENGFSFGKLFSNIFPNGIHVSAATIIGALASLTAVTGVVGTAINRYYYKLSGTDQIPFKGTFQSIFNSIKDIIISFCCCCRRGGYDDLEAPDLSNEKTPLLQPKFSIPTPQIVDETTQKSSDGGDNDDSSRQNSNNEYGSMSNEKKSSTSERKHRKIKRKSKISDRNDSTTEEKHINIDNDLQGKSIKDVISGKINKIFTEKIKPKINSIAENVGKKVESTDEVKKDLDIITKEAALISKLLENEKSSKNTDDVRSNEEIKAKNNSEKAQSNLIETQNSIVQEEIKSTTLDESQQSPNVEPLNEVTVSQLPVQGHQQIERNEQESDLKMSDRVTADELTKSTKNKNDIVMKSNIEKLQDTVITSPTDTMTKTNKSKLKFLGLEKEDENVQKVVSDKSIESDKKIDNEEDDVEVIEEIIYVDATDGAEDEEIIEEIIETTTIEDSPDESSPGSGHSKVTVRTTRKISSSSLPGEVKTIEETVVTDGIPENEKKLRGFQVGVGKSGLSMSVGEKNMEIGKSGIKFNRSKSKSPKNVEDDETSKRDTKSPEKSKKSMSLPKIFKRSISQPADDDIQEIEEESASKKKLSKTGSGLMKLRKSPSKSTVVLKTGDITMDKDAMSNFIDNERSASRLSNVGLQGEFDLTVSDEGVAAAVTTSEGKDAAVSIKTVEKSPKDLVSGSDRDQQSTKNTETKSNVKPKKPKKDKTKLTTLTRPF